MFFCLAVACGANTVPDRVPATAITTKIWVSFGADSGSDTLKFYENGTGTITEKRPSFSSVIEKKFNWRQQGDKVLLTTESGKIMSLKLDEYSFALTDGATTYFAN